MFVTAVIVTCLSLYSCIFANEYAPKSYSYNSGGRYYNDPYRRLDTFRSLDGKFGYRYQYGDRNSNVQVSFTSTPTYPQRKQKNGYDQNIASSNNQQYTSKPAGYVTTTTSQLTSKAIPVYIPSTTNVPYVDSVPAYSNAASSPVVPFEKAKQYSVGGHKHSTGTYKVPAYPVLDTKYLKYENPNDETSSFRHLYDYHPDTYRYAHPEKIVPLNVFGLPPKHRFQHPIGNVESSPPVVVHTNAYLPGPVVDSGVTKGSGHHEDGNKFHRLYEYHPGTRQLVNPERNTPLNVFGLPPRYRYQSPYGNVNGFRPQEVASNANLPGPVVDVTLRRPNLSSSFSGRVPTTGGRPTVGGDYGSQSQVNIQQTALRNDYNDKKPIEGYVVKGNDQTYGHSMTAPSQKSQYYSYTNSNDYGNTPNKYNGQQQQQQVAYRGQQQQPYNNEQKQQYSNKQQSHYGGQQQPTYGQQQQPSYGQQQLLHSGQQQPSYDRQQVSYRVQHRPSYIGQQQLSYNSQQQPSSGRQQMSYSGQHRPSYNSQQQPSYGGQQQPSYGGQQQSLYNGQQRPSYGGQQQPSYGGQQQPSYSLQRQPSYGGQQQPSYNGQQKTTYVNKQHTAYNNQQLNGGQQPSYSGQPGSTNSGQQHSYGDQKQPVKITPVSSDYTSSIKPAYGGQQSFTYGGQQAATYGGQQASTYGGQQQSAYNNQQQLLYSSQQQQIVKSQQSSDYASSIRQSVSQRPYAKYSQGPIRYGNSNGPHKNTYPLQSISTKDQYYGHSTINSHYRNIASHYNPPQYSEFQQNYNKHTSYSYDKPDEQYKTVVGVQRPSTNKYSLDGYYDSVYGQENPRYNSYSYYKPAEQYKTVNVQQLSNNNYQPEYVRSHQYFSRAGQYNEMPTVNNYNNAEYQQRLHGPQHGFASISSPMSGVQRGYDSLVGYPPKPVDNYENYEALNQRISGPLFSLRSEQQREFGGNGAGMLTNKLIYQRPPLDYSMISSSPLKESRRYDRSLDELFGKENSRIKYDTISRQDNFTNVKLATKPTSLTSKLNDTTATTTTTAKTASLPSTATTKKVAPLTNTTATVTTAVDPVLLTNLQSNPDSFLFYNPGSNDQLYLPSVTQSSYYDVLSRINNRRYGYNRGYGNRGNRGYRNSYYSNRDYGNYNRGYGYDDYDKPRPSLLSLLFPKVVKIGLGLGLTKEFELVKEHGRGGYYSYNEPQNGFQLKLGMGPFFEKKVLF